MHKIESKGRVLAKLAQNVNPHEFCLDQVATSTLQHFITCLFRKMFIKKKSNFFSNFFLRINRCSIVEI